MLRGVYGHLCRKMLGAWRPGPTIEISGDSGNLKAYAPRILSDIVPAPWLDFVADAQFPQLASAFAQDLVKLDVLTNIEVPLHILCEAARVRKPGARLVMM